MVAVDDDAMRGREPEARAAPDIVFRREERVEDPVPDLGRNARPVVGDLDDDGVAVLAPRGVGLRCPFLTRERTCHR
jgi:hypothetical protein